MPNDWAVEHLQTIRTLMERVALYRRALAPVTLLAGFLGASASVVGWSLQVNLPLQFTLYWLGVAGLATLAGLLIVRRQAFQTSEPFWSPPTRRVVQALAPPLAAGAVASVALALTPPPRFFLWLPALWLVFYGCGLNAAGFFMPRGVKWLGGLFIAAGAALWLVPSSFEAAPAHGHLLMGALFGGLHLLYGVYLHFTERRGETE